jgi:photosystem II stability/assembly factor-like uncharacterized protein
VKGTRGILVGAVMICAILMAFTMSYPLAQSGQWVDINQHVINLNSVFMLSPTSGWAVGDLGTIMSWNGHEWALVQSPTTLNLYSVLFPDTSNPNNGWAVGQLDLVSGFPAILHWDGVAWVRLDTSNGISWTAGQVGDLWSLHFRSPSDGWAVGVGTTTQPGVVTNIVHWSGGWGAGGSWTIKATPPAALPFDLFSVQVLSNTATPVGGYAVGGNPGAGIILYWDGANWNVYGGSVPAAALRSISMLSSTDAWAVGDAIGANPTVIRLTGTTWGGPMSLSALGIRNLYSVLTIDANSAFAVGTLSGVGGTDIIRFATPTWTPVSSPATVDLFSITKVMTGSSDIWSVGFGGTILRNTAGSWRVLTSPVGAGNLVVPPPVPIPNLRSVHFTAANDGWAVGDSGTIIKYDGTTWSTYQTAPIVPNNLYSIYTISPIDGWAVGANGAILRLTGSGWGVVAQCPGPTCLQNVPLRSIFEFPTGEAWVVGESPGGGQPGTILHWVPPGPWAQVPSNTPPNMNLYSVFFLADGSEGWAVGNPAILGPSTVIDHWKSGVWTVVSYNPPIAGNLALDSVVIVNNNPSNVWIAGTSSVVGGIVLHYDGTIWEPVPVNQIGMTTWTAISFVPGSTNDAWIVGGVGGPNGGQTLHWDGTAWTNVPLVPRPYIFPTFRSVQMLGPNEGWAVGDLGHIIKLGPPPFSTVTSTSTIYTTMTSSSTSTSTTSSSVTSPASTWGVPGFPVESIFAGLLGGLMMLTIIRRQRKL